MDRPSKVSLPLELNFDARRTTCHCADPSSDAGCDCFSSSAAIGTGRFRADIRTTAQLRKPFVNVTDKAGNSVRLNEWNEPKPDIALLSARDDFYASRHPGPEDILLIVEVADSSLKFECVCVFGVHGSYLTVRQLRRGDVWTPMLLPDCTLLVDTCRRGPGPRTARKLRERARSWTVPTRKTWQGFNRSRSRGFSA